MQYTCIPPYCATLCVHTEISGNSENLCLLRPSRFLITAPKGISDQKVHMYARTRRCNEDIYVPKEDSVAPNLGSGQ